MATPLFTFVLVSAQLRHADHFVSLAKVCKTAVHTRSHVTTYVYVYIYIHQRWICIYHFCLSPRIYVYIYISYIHATGANGKMSFACTKMPLGHYILRANSRQPKCWELTGLTGLCNLVGFDLGQSQNWFKKCDSPSLCCLVTIK